MKNLAPALAPARFAIKFRQNPAPVGFGKSKSGITLQNIALKMTNRQCCNMLVATDSHSTAVISNLGRKVQTAMLHVLYCSILV